MTLVVEAPARREPERRYVMDVVLADRLGLAWRFEASERRDVRITLDGDASGACVLLPDVLLAVPEERWLAPGSLPASPLPWRPVPPTAASAAVAGRRLPVLFGGGPDAGDLVRTETPAVAVDVDVFGSCFFMLTRYEECVVPDRDARGRFPATASVAFREGFLGLPLADAYVELMWSALALAWPRLERAEPRYAVALTHDVDDPLASLGRRPSALVRQLGADALRRRDAALAAQRMRSWAGMARGDHRHDPYNTFGFLMDVSERHGLAGAFYFRAAGGTTPPREPPYTLEHPWVRGLLRRVHARGHEVGFHAGFGTHRDAARTAEEFGRLRRAAAREGIRQDAWGGRQHYLMWENPDTWSNWDGAGLDYDTTLGFADRIGFRAGTCHAFRTFDLLRRCPLRLRERPLHVMDGTLFEYMRLAPDAAREQALAVADECRRHRGMLSLLWHNDVLMTSRRRHWYAELVDAVAASP
jgi:hypothetical protein